MIYLLLKYTTYHKTMLTMFRISQLFQVLNQKIDMGICLILLFFCLVLEHEVIHMNQYKGNESYEKQLSDIIRQNDMQGET